MSNEIRYTSKTREECIESITMVIAFNEEITIGLDDFMGREMSDEMNACKDGYEVLRQRTMQIAFAEECGEAMVDIIGENIFDYTEAQSSDHIMRAKGKTRVGQPVSLKTHLAEEAYSTLRDQLRELGEVHRTDLQTIHATWYKLATRGE